MCNDVRQCFFMEGQSCNTVEIIQKFAKYRVILHGRVKELCYLCLIEEVG